MSWNCVSQQYQLIWNEKHFSKKTLPSPVTYLVVFVPGQALSSKDEPVPLRASLHDADVADG